MTKYLLTVVLILSVLLSACGGGEATATPVEAAAPTTAAAREEPPTPTAAPEQSPEATSAAPQEAGSGPVGGERAKTVEEVDSIATYRMSVEVMSEGKPTAQIEVAHVKEPIAEEDVVVLYDKDRQITAHVRYVNDTLYLKNGEQWAVISTFNLAELTVITPAAMTQAAPEMTLVGEEEVSGRRTLHLQGDKNVIPRIQSGSDSLDAKLADEAQLDLWLDAEEYFIVKLFFSLTIEGRTFTTEFLYHDFNAPIVVEVPTNVEEVAAPPTPLPAEVTALLGFDFPIPEGAQLSVVARTANILTPFLVPEARAYLEEAMTAAGFTQAGEPTEPAANEFTYTFERDDMTVTANVFSVVANKTTIQIRSTKK